MKLHIYIPAIVFVAVCWFALSSTPFLQGIFRLPRLPVWGMFLSSVLSDTWGQGSSGLQSVDQLPHFPLVRLSYSEHPSAEDLLTSPQDFHDLTAPVIVISTGQAPGRRTADGEPFLTVQGDGAELPVSRPLQAAINAAADGLERVLQRRLFPMHLQAVDFTPYLSRRQLTNGASRPFAIYDASRGRVLIDARLSLSLNEDHVQHMAGLLVQEVYSRLASSFKLGVNCSGSTAVHLMAQALTLAVPAAFAAAPPLWFCLLCPVLLGLIAPLAINFGLGELAGVLCTKLQLDDTQCFDLMLGALGLGFVLALAAAIPIFFACRLMECVHRNTSGTRVQQQ